jgi:UDP-N-acetylmuramate dehydrogenase
LSTFAAEARQPRSTARPAPERRGVGIDPRVLDELERMAPEQTLAAEPMARHTSLGLGGPADVFVEPRDASTFRECADYLAEAGVPVTLLGRGTNLLVRSGGIEGAVLTPGKAFTRLERDGDSVRAGGGVGLPRLLTFCADEGLGGLEGLSGIPGSAGGAVATNAGSFGVSIGDRLAGVIVSQPGGRSTRLSSDELETSYRSCRLPAGGVVEQLELLMEPADPRDIRKRATETLEKKWRTQPSGMRSAGCVFRNPEGDAAGRLIDRAGLKGVRVGGAVVSDLHANFILNDRGGTPEDVEELIEIIRARVFETSGVTLELEIQVMGRAA